MFERVLDSGARSRTGSTAISLPASLSIHAAAFGGLFAVTFLAVGTIREPASSALPVFVIPTPPPPAAAAPPRGAAHPRAVEEKKAPVPEKLPEMIQPEIVPEQVPAPDADDAEGDPSGVEGGMEGGVPGGVPGGDPDGVVGGIPGGAPGGTGLPDAGLPVEDEPVPLTGDVRAPILVFKVEPEYPAFARRANHQGKVVLEIVVGRDGDVEEARVLKSDPLLDQAAIEAVMRWRYDPALQNGRPLKVYMTVVVTFRLK